jgi:hypothetical protein
VSEFLPPIVLPIEAKMSDLVRTLGEADAAIRVFAKDEKRVLADAGDDGGREFSQGLERGLRRSAESGLAAGFFGGLLRGVGAAATPTLFTGLIYGAAQAIAAIAPVVGTLNLIPAAAIGAATALATLHMAFKGVGGALSAGAAGDMEKYAEALKKLAPAARDSVRALLSLQPLMRSMQQTVQQNVFQGLAHDLKAIGELYIPMLRGELGQLGTAFNVTFKRVLEWFRVPEVFKSIHQSLINIRQGLANSMGFLPGMLSGLKDLVAVGSTFLPALGSGFTALGDRFAAFMARIAASGELADWIQGGLDALKLVVPLLKDVWGILHPIIQALNATSGGGLGFLGTLLHSLSEFLSSQQGMDTLTATFKILSDIFGFLGGALMQILPALGQVMVALVPLFDAISHIQPDVMRQLGDSLAQLVTAWAPVVPIWTELVVKLLPALIPLIKILGAVTVAGIPGGILMWRMLLNWVHVFESLVQNAHRVGPVLRAIGSWFAELPHRIGAGLRALPGLLLNLGHEAMQRFAYAIGFGIGLVVKELNRMPGQIYDLLRFLGSTTVDIITKTIDHWVKLFTSTPGKAKSAMSGLPGQIKSIFFDAIHWLEDAGRAMVQGLINGVASMWSKSIDFIKDLGHSLVKGFRDAIGWHSPSAVFAEGGAAIVAGLVKGILDNAGHAVAAASGLLSGVGGLGGPRLGLAGVGGLRGGGLGGGGAPVIHVMNRVYLDGKELHAGLIQPAQRYKGRTGTTGLT